MSSPIPWRACRVIPHSRCAHSVIPHFDAESREYPPWSADLFIITFFSLPNRLRCGHPVIPHSDAGFRNIGKGHPALRRGIQRIPASLLVRFFFLDPASLCGVTRFSTRNLGYSRGLYPKETAGSIIRTSRNARPVHPESPFSFPAKEKGEPKESSRLMSES